MFEPIDGGRHSQHKERIVQVRRVRAQEGKGFSGSGNAARDEEFGEDCGQTRFAGEGSGFIGMRFGEDPALRRKGAS
jgi:hypothetical protein